MAQENTPQQQQQSTPVAPVPGTPEHDAAMIAKFDNVGVTPHQAADAPQKPEGVPDKFWNAEKGEVNYAAWAKSTQELEQAFTKSKQQPTPQANQQQQSNTPDPVKVHADKTAELRKAYTDLKAKQDAKPEDVSAAAAALADHLSTEPAKPEAKDDAANNAVQSAGLNMDALKAEYAEKGELSAESYAAFEKIGITRDIVDQHIAGQHALANEIRTSSFALVGGEENYSKMAEWARTNMTPAQKEAYNSALGGTAESRALAIQGLFQQYTAANGAEPSLLGGSRAGSDASVFRSNAEMTAAIKDPRYQKDPAYRADVEAKIGRSNL